MQAPTPKLPTPTPQEWKAILAEASSEQPHGYIVSEGGTIKVNKLTSGNQKLSISQIVEITEKVLQDPSATPDEKTKIVNDVKIISDRKSAKMNTFINQVGRICLSCLKIASYAPVIGIPIGRFIRDIEKTYINPHIAEVKQAEELYENYTYYLQPLENVAKKCETPDILEKFSELLLGTISDDLKTVDTDGMLKQFRLDHVREGLDFTLTDGKKKYTSPILQSSSSTQQPQEHPRTVYQGMRQFIGDRSEDQKWLGPLQSVLSQLPLVNATLYVTLAYPDTDWENTPYQNHKMLVTPESRVLTVEIIRENGCIKALNVSTIITSQIHYEKTPPFATLTTRCSFRLTLDKDNNPVVDSYQVTHTPTLGVAQSTNTTDDA